MRRTTVTRAIGVGAPTVAAVTTTVMWLGAGTAAAHQPDDRGVDLVTEDAAYGSLPAPDADLAVMLSVFDGAGDEEIAGVEVFGSFGPGPDDYYECFEGPPIPADLDGLEGARAMGSTTLTCGGPTLAGDVVAQVDVDVVWEPVGRIDRWVDAGPESPCIWLAEERAAELAGLVTVTIPALGITATMTEGFGDLRTSTGICPPAAG